MVIHLEMYNPATGETEMVNARDKDHMRGKLWDRGETDAKEYEITDTIIDAVAARNALVHALCSEL